MKLIKQLNEVARASMNQETFERLVQFALEDIQAQGVSGDKNAMMEVIFGLIENVAGYEDTRDAAVLANKVFTEVKKRV